MADDTATALPPPRQPGGSYRVCVVCLGNICRSPMAEVVLRHELALAGLAGKVEVDSAGTGDWHLGGPMDRRARAELARRGHDGDAHRARQFQPGWFSRYDLILAMDRANLATLRRLAPEHDHHRIALFRSFDPDADVDDPNLGEVPDPYGGSDADYALALDLILPAARGLVAALTATLGAAGGPAGQ